MSQQDISPRGTATRPHSVVLFGHGTVGGGVYEWLGRWPERFELRRVIIRDQAKHAALGVPPALLSTNPWDAVNVHSDLVIEVAGGLDPAADVIAAALLQGKQVVSANKAAVASRWEEFAPFLGADDRPAQLRIGAAVGGAVPMIEAVRRHRGRILELRGIVNGTCNYVLDRLECGDSFADAVRAAQAAGFAEADPAADVTGADSAHKLLILARTAVPQGRAPARFRQQGIEHITARDVSAAGTRGRRLRLVARASFDIGETRCAVSPIELDANDWLAGARAEENRLELTLVDGERVRLKGPGAGRWPTTRAVMRDVLRTPRPGRHPDPHPDPLPGRERGQEISRLSR